MNWQTVRLSTKGLAIVAKSNVVNLSETTNKLTSIPYASANIICILKQQKTINGCSP